VLLREWTGSCECELSHVQHFRRGVFIIAFLHAPGEHHEAICRDGDRRAHGLRHLQGRYTRLVATVPVMATASPEAAGAAAARQILVRLYPNQRAKIEEAYAASLKTIADGSAKSETPCRSAMIWAGKLPLT
jgi:hypothetical protein